MRYYDHTYVLPGERFPRRASTIDPATRDVVTLLISVHDPRIAISPA